MNLKMKLTHKVTSAVQIISDTQCIFSDECSPTHMRALVLINAPDREQLMLIIKKHAVNLAAQTKFPPILALIDEHNHIEYLNINGKVTAANEPPLPPTQ